MVHSQKKANNEYVRVADVRLNKNKKKKEKSNLANNFSRIVVHDANIILMWLHLRSLAFAILMPGDYSKATAFRDIAMMKICRVE